MKFSALVKAFSLFFAAMACLSVTSAQANNYKSEYKLSIVVKSGRIWSGKEPKAGLISRSIAVPHWFRESKPVNLPPFARG